MGTKITKPCAVRYRSRLYSGTARHFIIRRGNADLNTIYYPPYTTKWCIHFRRKSTQLFTATSTLNLFRENSHHPMQCGKLCHLWEFQPKPDMRDIAIRWVWLTWCDKCSVSWGNSKQDLYNNCIYDFKKYSFFLEHSLYLIFRHYWKLRSTPVIIKSVQDFLLQKTIICIWQLQVPCCLTMFAIKRYQLCFALFIKCKW